MFKPKEIAYNEWHVVDRKKLAVLKDMTNVVFKKAKNNPVLGVPEDETSDVIADQMVKKAREINYSASKRTMDRRMTEVKVSSVLDGGFSVAKSGIKKTCTDTLPKIHCAKC